MKTKLLTVSLLSLMLFAFLYLKESPKPYKYNGKRHKGLSFVAPSEILDSVAFISVKNTNSGWVSLMPYGFVGKESVEFKYNKRGEPIPEGDYQWWGEKPHGVIECIKMAKEQGLGIMLKPHMWIGRGTFTGDFKLEKEEEWQIFEKTYGAYILQYAQIAEEQDVEVLCIATEMHTMVAERPQFWNDLIKEIRLVYSGKLTYAENWDAYERVPFWDQLDFIGVDAYFPLAKGANPSEKALAKGWKPWLEKLGKFSTEHQKPVLFTEIGYRSCDFSTEKPWETNYDLPDNEALQHKAYKVFFENVWHQEWLAGAYLWKWFPLPPRRGKYRDKFAFQNKEAMDLIKSSYGQ